MDTPPLQPIQRNPGIGRSLFALTCGLLSGVLLVVLPYLAVWLYGVFTHKADNGSMTAMSGYNMSLTFLFPLVQGLGVGLGLGRKTFDRAVSGILIVCLFVIEVLGAAIFMHEGIICLVILSPLILAMMSFGVWFGRLLARRNAGTYQVSLIPLIIAAVLIESAGPRPDYATAVTDSVTVDAPPQYVWRYIVQYPENTAPPEYWLWRIGLPEPIQSVAEAPRVGAKRLCRFSGNIAFEERITELVPNRVMTFAVTKQPDNPEVIGHFRFDTGQIRLTDNGDGTTTVTATSWYHLFVRPAAYFDWWTADITRHVHVRVLNHMKALAEQDYKTGRPI